MSQSERWQWAMEARAAPELAAFVATVGPLARRRRGATAIPSSCSPGLGGGDASTRPLRWFLDRLGYRTSGWGLGTNTGPSRRVTDGLDELLAGPAASTADGSAWSAGASAASTPSSSPPHARTASAR